MTQMTPRLPRAVWDGLRAGSIVAALALCVSLFIAPRVGLFFFWALLIPLLPLLFLLAPGFWRNVCPLASVHQLPRRFGFTRGLVLPAWLQRHGYLLAVALFLGIVPARKVLFNENGVALALLLLGVLAVGLAAGTLFKGKSGWCSTFCPLLPVQRIYGQTPFTVVRNSHCEPCVGCTTNCYDFNPRVAQLADVHGDDELRADYRGLFAGAFPALVLAFYTLPAGDGAWGIAAMYGEFGLAILIGIGAFFLARTLLPVPPATLTVLFGAAALNAYYWFNVPELAERIAGSAPWWWVWPARAGVLTLTLVWIMRSYRKEERFVESVSSEPAIALGAGSTGAFERVSQRETVEVTILPEERTVAAAPGVTLLEIAERNGLPVEAGCRMGVCGSDPVCVPAGAENLSAPTDDERMTLERLDLADNTRMACSARVLGPVSMSPTPQRRETHFATVGAAPDSDTSVRRVVIVGNGIAGVTAADFVRRRNPSCSIDIVGRERHHLYNRMAITRLIYGRSAMQGLYLLPEAWYDERNVTCWLNTHLTHVDREESTARLATGDVLPYDRLIVTSGSSSFVPPIDGFGAPGSFALRTADDAMAIRAFVQETGGRRAVVAGGGLLGLEVAYALQKLGVRVTVLALQRVLDRQLDERGARFLQRFLEGLGLEIQAPAHAVAIVVDGRVTGVTLGDGRVLPCELFVVATGISPNVDVARAAGLEVGRGIVVDDRMQTSDPRIYAAGDAAEHDGLVLGLWPTAVEQAQVAATNATGGDMLYDGTPPATSLKVTGVELTSVGRFEPEPGETAIVLEEPSDARYRKLVLARDGSIAGAILLGHPLEAPGIIDAIKTGRDVRPFLDDLRTGDWSAFVDSAALPAQRTAAQG